jgi:hypothetical protein
MEHSKRIEDLVRSRVSGFHKLLSLERHEGTHIAHYIKISMYNHEPSFLVDYIHIDHLDIKAEIRNSLIEDLLDNKGEDLEETFDIESIIYSDEQQKRLEELRSGKTTTWRNIMVPPGINFKEEIRQVKMEWANSFTVGEPVYYNGHHATITFKHQNEDKGYQLWSVRVGDDEHRYVCGTKLSKRKVEKAKPLAQKDKRPEDKRLEKLSTERLLKMYKAGMKRNRGIGNAAIKRILNEREHVKKGEGKTIIVPH